MTRVLFTSFFFTLYHSYIYVCYFSHSFLVDGIYASFVLIAQKLYHDQTELQIDQRTYSLDMQMKVVDFFEVCDKGNSEVQLHKSQLKLYVIE